jgi:hypothetical protein
MRLLIPQNTLSQYMFWIEKLTSKPSLLISASMGQFTTKTLTNNGQTDKTPETPITVVKTMENFHHNLELTILMLSIRVLMVVDSVAVVNIIR